MPSLFSCEFCENFKKSSPPVNTLEQIRTPPVAASVIRRKTKRVCFDKPFIWFCNFYFVIRCYLCFFWNDRTQKLLIPLPCLSYTKFCCSSMCFIHFSNTLTIWVIQCCIWFTIYTHLNRPWVEFDSRGTGKEWNNVLFWHNSEKIISF